MQCKRPEMGQTAKYTFWGAFLDLTYWKKSDYTANSSYLKIKSAEYIQYLDWAGVRVSPSTSRVTTATLLCCTLMDGGRKYFACSAESTAEKKGKNSLHCDNTPNVYKATDHIDWLTVSGICVLWLTSKTGLTPENAFIHYQSSIENNITME